MARKAFVSCKYCGQTCRTNISRKLEVCFCCREARGLIRKEITEATRTYEAKPLSIQWSPGDTMDQFKDRLILAVYEMTHRNKMKTAQELGLSLRCIRNRMKKIV